MSSAWAMTVPQKVSKQLINKPGNSTHQKKERDTERDREREEARVTRSSDHTRHAAWKDDEHH